MIFGARYWVTCAFIVILQVVMLCVYQLFFLCQNQINGIKTFLASDYMSESEEQKLEKHNDVKIANAKRRLELRKNNQEPLLDEMKKKRNSSGKKKISSDSELKDQLNVLKDIEEEPVNKPCSSHKHRAGYKADGTEDFDQFMKRSYAHPVEKFMDEKNMTFKKIDQTEKLKAYSQWI